MNAPLRLLLIEDSEDDALLLLRELKHGGLDVTHTRVETLDGLESALDAEAWDIAVSDFMLPDFNGLDALERIKARQPDLPFIMVSGKLGEDAAVEAMRAGAKDYITKGNLSRLVPAVRRELEEAANRRAKLQSDARANHSEERFRSLFNAVSDAIFFTDMQGHIQEVNAEACRRLDYRREELLAMTLLAIEAPENAANVQERLRAIGQEGRGTFESVQVRRDGARIPTEVAGRRVDASGAPGILAVARDISGRKRAEEERLAYTRHLQEILEDTIHAIAATIEKRDAYTAGHQFRVSTLSVAIAREMGLNEDRITGIRLGALIHDIGLISIPAEILSRPSALSAVEFRLVMI
ncbi:MAG: PAS domain S-box protein, partial [Kiritimatiellia bacterium]